MDWRKKMQMFPLNMDYHKTHQIKHKGSPTLVGTIDDFGNPFPPGGESRN